MKTKTKLWIGAVAGLVLVVALLVGIKAGQIATMIKAGKSFVPPPESVTSTKVEAGEWESARSAVATLVALRAVTLGSELPGLVREIEFDSGSAVRKGAVLLKLDTSIEETQLASALADAHLAKVNLERAQNLRQAGSSTPAELDTARARAELADGAVATLRATIAKKTIRAPFDGRVAIRQVELGQVLAAGAPVVSLTTVTPIYADFWLPQQALVDVKTGQRVRVTTDTYPGAQWEGLVSIISPEVDPSTRNVRIRATVPNADGRLRPGMFANVDVVSSEKRHVLFIPATAVLFAPYGDSVFAIEEKKDDAGKSTLTVRQKFVRLADRRGDFVAVTAGLTAGETIVSNGAFKLRNGMTVVVNNALSPPAELAPKPTD